jgi:hypothetical protein
MNAQALHIALHHPEVIHIAVAPKHYLRNKNSKWLLQSNEFSSSKRFEPLYDYGYVLHYVRRAEHNNEHSLSPVTMW